MFLHIKESTAAKINVFIYVPFMNAVQTQFLYA